MSWDFGMEIDAGGLEPHSLHYDANYTYNVAPMFLEAMGGDGIRQLDGLIGEECLPLLGKAIADMVENPGKYKAMNPSNGWGDFDGALELLQTLVKWCNEAPKATMRIT